MSEQIRREFTLAFPIEKVKNAIENAAHTSAGSYVINNRNEAFNSYSISLVKNLYALSSTISLRPVSENETHFEFSAVPGPQLTRMAHFTNSLIEDFLKRVGDYASGVYTAQAIDPKQVPANKGCAVILVIAGAGAIAAVYFGLK